MDHLAERALVVGRAELEQFEVAGRERRDILDHLRDLAKARIGHIRPGRPGDHDANLGRLAERHDHEAPARGIEAIRNQEIEGLLEGDVEGDAGDFHGSADPLFRGPGSLWITL